MISPSRFENRGLGYNLSRLSEVSKRALIQAHQILLTAEQDGARMRQWATSVRQRIESFFEFAKTSSATLDSAGFFEIEISDCVRSYFSNVTANMGQLKELNPPLYTEQLDPYLEAILSDRRQTMAELEPLSALIDRLRSLKPNPVERAC